MGISTPLPFRFSFDRRPGRSLGRPALLVATLALAIGANTVLFSIVNLFVLRALPIAAPESVAFVGGTDSATGDRRAKSSLDDYLDLRDRNRSFAELAAFRRDAVTLASGGEPVRVGAAEATASLFSAWRLETQLGRVLEPADEAPGAAPVVVLSDRSWRERFDAAPGVLGRTLLVEGVPRTVVGVLRPDLEIGNFALIEVWRPLGTQPGSEPRERRDLTVTGRLAPGVTHAAASAEVEAISLALRAEHPATNAHWLGRAVDVRRGLVGDGVWITLGFLGLVVAGVLLVACANVTNLLLAQVAERRAELATRVALGATAKKLALELLGEQAVIAAASCAGGLGLAALGLRLARSLSYEPIWGQFTIDANVLLFAAALAVAALALAGIAPAIDVARSNLASTLHGAQSRGATSRGGARLRRLLVAGQLGAAVLVVVPASLVGRSIANESGADWGFDGRGLVGAQLHLPAVSYPDVESRRLFAERLASRLATEGELAHAALVDPQPLFGPDRTVGLEVAGAAAISRPEDRAHAALVGATPELFETLGVAAVAGERLPRALVAGAPIPALVNRTFATRWLSGGLAGGEPLGRRLRLGEPLPAGDEVVVVGVVADVKSGDVALPAPPALYLPLAALASAELALVARGNDDATTAAALRRAVAAVDPTIALERPASYAQLWREETSSNRTIAGLFAAFASIAVALAVVGLFAVATLSVTQRTREIGLRLAMGADRRRIVREVVGSGVRLAFLGGGVGLVLGAGLAQLLRNRLFGVSPLDPVTFGGAVVGLALFALLATALPARRAAKVDPAELLRVS